MQKKLYLAYGSNLNLAQMAHRCPTANPIGGTVIHDYELLFRGSRSSAVATIEPQEGGKVPVLLWEIGAKDEMALNQYEGYPTFYRQETLTVPLPNDRSLSAMVYIMNDGHQFGTPSDYYLTIIKEGYATAGFDPEFLQNAVEKSALLALEQAQETQSQGFSWGQLY